MSTKESTGGNVQTLTLDCESTGVDVSNDRIITFFMRVKQGEEVLFEQNWVLNPGVEIPEEASAVHGMDTAWVEQNGRTDIKEALSEILDALRQYSGLGYVVCGYNHAFDLAMLESELLRHGVVNPPGMMLGSARYIDPAIFSRKFDKYKKGGHQLITVAKRNGIEVEEDRLHAADYDVEVTEKLVKVFLNRAWKELASLRQGLTPDEFITKLQEWQATEKAEWADGLTHYFESKGKREEDGSKIVVSGAFPW